jgi:hypothetical protein
MIMKILSYAFAFKSVLTAEKAEVILRKDAWNVSKKMDY